MRDSGNNSTECALWIIVVLLGVIAWVQVQAFVDSRRHAERTAVYTQSFQVVPVTSGLMVVPPANVTGSIGSVQGVVDPRGFASPTILSNNGGH